MSNAKKGRRGGSSRTANIAAPSAAPPAVSKSTPVPAQINTETNIPSISQSNNQTIESKIPTLNHSHPTISTGSTTSSKPNSHVNSPTASSAAKQQPPIIQSASTSSKRSSLTSTGTGTPRTSDVHEFPPLQSKEKSAPSAPRSVQPVHQTANQSNQPSSPQLNAQPARGPSLSSLAGAMIEANAASRASKTAALRETLKKVQKTSSPVSEQPAPSVNQPSNNQTDNQSINQSSPVSEPATEPAVKPSRSSTPASASKPKSSAASKRSSKSQGEAAALKEAAKESQTPVKETIKESINGSHNQTINQSTNQPIKESVKEIATKPQPADIVDASDKPVSKIPVSNHVRSNGHSNNQSTNQSKTPSKTSSKTSTLKHAQFDHNTFSTDGIDPSFDAITAPTSSINQSLNPARLAASAFNTNAQQNSKPGISEEDMAALLAVADDGQLTVSKSAYMACIRHLTKLETAMQERESDLRMAGELGETICAENSKLEAAIDDLARQVDQKEREKQDFLEEKQQFLMQNHELVESNKQLAQMNLVNQSNNESLALLNDFIRAELTSDATRTSLDFSGLPAAGNAGTSTPSSSKTPSFTGDLPHDLASLQRKLRRERRAWERSVQALEAALQQGARDRQELNAANAQLEADLNELRSKQSEMQKSFEQQQTQWRERESALQQENTTKAASARKSLDNQLVEAQSSTQRVKNELETEVKRREEAEKRQAVLQQKIDSLTRSLQDTQTQLKTSQSQLSDQESKLRSAEADYARIQSELTELHSAVADSNNDNVNAKVELTAVESKLRASNERISHLEADVARLQSLNQDVQNEVMKAKEEVTNQRSINQSLKEDLSKARDELRAVNQSLKEESSKNQSLQEELVQAREETHSSVQSTEQSRTAEMQKALREAEKTRKSDIKKALREAEQEHKAQMDTALQAAEQTRQAHLQKAIEEAEQKRVADVQKAIHEAEQTRKSEVQKAIDEAEKTRKSEFHKVNEEADVLRQTEVLKAIEATQETLRSEKQKAIDAAEAARAQLIAEFEAERIENSAQLSQLTDDINRLKEEIEKKDAELVAAINKPEPIVEVVRPAEPEWKLPTPGFKLGSKDQKLLSGMFSFLSHQWAIAQVLLPGNTKIKKTVDWIDDSVSDECLSCRTSFGFVFGRKHHCRLCGGLFCGDCSSHKIDIPKLKVSQVRVCQPCFNVAKLLSKGGESLIVDRTKIQKIVHKRGESTTSSSAVMSPSSSATDFRSVRTLTTIPLDNNNMPRPRDPSSARSATVVPPNKMRSSTRTQPVSRGSPSIRSPSMGSIAQANVQQQSVTTFPLTDPPPISDSIVDADPTSPMVRSPSQTVTVQISSTQPIVSDLPTDIQPIKPKSKAKTKTTANGEKVVRKKKPTVIAAPAVV